MRPRWPAASTSYRLASCAATTAATVRSKELIDSGKFGAPMVIKCTHRADGVADDYTTAMAVTDTAIHEIDVLPWLVNDEWDEVQCIMPKTNSKVKNALKDPQIMIMKTKGGIINMLEVNVNCGFGYDINCEVVCENGVVNLPVPVLPDRSLR